LVLKLSESKLFEILLNAVKFDITEYLIMGDLSESQKKIVDDATFILKDNIVGDVKALGGNLKKNENKFSEYEKKLEEELKQDKYKDSKKELKNLLKEYKNDLKKLIEKTVVAIIPVKEMPWVDIIFRTVPRIVIDKKKTRLNENAIAYYGEIKCIISRTTLFGKMKNAKPLFAPFIGDLDLGGYKLEESQKGSKSQIYPYVSAIIDALDNATTRSQLAKYHEGYQRHGEPICDFLMKDEELMKSMEKLTSGIDSKRINSDVAVCGIAIPLSDDNTTFVLAIDESKDSNKYTKCFEAVLRFSAACCEAPSSRRGDIAQQAAQMTRVAQGQQSVSGPGIGGLTSPPSQPITSQSAQPGGAIRTPGGQELKVWTPEELAKAAQQRGGGIPSNMDVWTEEDLSKLATERGPGIPEGMEVWTEEDLQELARKRQGGLDIPEWKQEDNLPECPKCGYGLRKGWSECPICNTPINATSSPPTKQSSTSDESKAEKTPEKENHPQSSEEKKEI